MSELPEAWATCPFLSVADLLRGVTYTKTDSSSEPFSGSVPVLRANNIQDRRFDLTDLVHVPKRLVSDQQLVRRGDVVVATSSGSISVVGKAAQALEDMNAGFGAFCGLLRPKLGIHAPYFGFFFSTDVYRKTVSALARGVNINNLKREHFESLELPIAPLAEQKRIADKLEAVLGQVDACRARLDRVPDLLKRFRQSVLAAATSGQLTEDWREQNKDKCVAMPHEVMADDLEDLPSGWFWTCPDKIKKDERYALAIGPFGSNLKVSDYCESGVPLVFVREIRARSFGGPNTKYVTREKAEELKAHSASGGDLLITKMGDPPGDVAVYPANAPQAIITADCIKLRVDTAKADTTFVSYVIESPQARARLLDIVAGVAQQKISLERFRDFPLQLAPLAEQTEIVRRVEALFALADRIEARLATAQRLVERLTPATLSKAFRGDLVPQDPNDEPASKLLERLNAKKSTQSSSPKKKPFKSRPMAELSLESLKQVISQMPSDQFTFDDLRAKAGGDYETLSRLTLELLSERSAIVRQIFDPKQKIMHFSRTKP